MFPTSEKTTQTIKVVLAGDTRRLTLSFEAGTSARAAHEAIQRAVSESFHLPGSAPLVLKYRDDEGDLCTLAEGSMQDLAEIAAGGVWRLEGGLRAPPATPVPEQLEQPVPTRTESSPVAAPGTGGLPGLAGLAGQLLGGQQGGQPCTGGQVGAQPMAGAFAGLKGIGKGLQGLLAQKGLGKGASGFQPPARSAQAAAEPVANQSAGAAPPLGGAACPADACQAEGPDFSRGVNQIEEGLAGLAGLAEQFFGGDHAGGQGGLAGLQGWLAQKGLGKGKGGCGQGFVPAAVSSAQASATEPAEAVASAGVAEAAENTAACTGAASSPTGASTPAGTAHPPGTAQPRGQDFGRRVEEGLADFAGQFLGGHAGGKGGRPGEGAAASAPPFMGALAGFKGMLAQKGFGKGASDQGSSQGFSGQGEAPTDGGPLGAENPWMGAIAGVKGLLAQKGFGKGKGFFGQGFEPPMPSTKTPAQEPGAAPKPAAVPTPCETPEPAEAPNATPAHPATGCAEAPPRFADATSVATMAAAVAAASAQVAAQVAAQVGPVVAEARQAAALAAAQAGAAQTGHAQLDAAQAPEQAVAQDAAQMAAQAGQVAAHAAALAEQAAAQAQRVVAELASAQVAQLGGLVAPPEKDLQGDAVWHDAVEKEEEEEDLGQEIAALRDMGLVSDAAVARDLLRAHGGSVEKVAALLMG